jgi:hypothetical protein
MPGATFLEVLVATLCRVSEYNSNDQTAPVAVIWTDKERQWEPLLPRLRSVLPIITLGMHNQAERAGPAYWLRATLAGALSDEVSLPADAPPIVYLPGYSRQELRAVEDCPRELQPIAELQYRGVLWSQKNTRDWTIAAFLQNSDEGLGIEVGSDNATKDALVRSVRVLADEPIERLKREAPLRSDFLNALLNPDEARSILLWLDSPDDYRSRLEPERWSAFRETCRRRYQFDPEKDGAVTAAGYLGKRDGHWSTVWKRLAESPASYSALPERLRQARPTGTPSMFDFSESWPQDNELAEAAVRTALAALAEVTASVARSEIGKLESEHADRRTWVWAQLGQSPMAMALEHLNLLAQATQKNISGGSSVADIAAAYAEWGWKVDAHALAALGCVEQSADAAAVGAAMRATYRPWLDAGAMALQHAVLAAPSSYAPGDHAASSIESGTCMVFSDGLRFDLAHQLIALLAQTDATADLEWTLAALPTITSTAKPAIAPIGCQLQSGADLTPRSPTGTALDVTVLRKLLGESGFQVLRGEETGDPTGKAWTELGDIDGYGHDFGLKVARHAVGEVRALRDRVRGLLDAGWQRVVVVTDHGWLLLPGGLPKVDLPEHLTEVRKGRCARLKDGSTTELPTVAWQFDPQVRVAIAPGISCFTANQVYEHGGISPQECVVPIVMVEAKAIVKPVSIESITWRGLRCTVQVAGELSGLQVDLRLKAADAASSLCGSTKPLDENGRASVLVADEDHMESAAFAVVVSSDGTIRAQVPTGVGG